MLITMQRSGGFAAIPGLCRPVEVDTEQLAGSVAEAVEELVRELCASPLPAVIPPPRGAADFHTIRLRVRAPDVERTWEFTDAVRDRVLLALIEILERHV